MILGTQTVKHLRKQQKLHRCIQQMSLWMTSTTNRFMPLLRPIVPWSQRRSLVQREVRAVCRSVGMESWYCWWSEIRRSPVDMVKYPRGGNHLTLYAKQPEFSNAQLIWKNIDHYFICKGFSTMLGGFLAGCLVAINPRNRNVSCGGSKKRPTSKKGEVFYPEWWECF